MRVKPRGFSLWMFSELSQPISTQLRLGQICSDEAACGALITLIASEDRSLPMFVATCWAEQPFKALQWGARANIWLQSVLEVDVQNTAVQFRGCAAQICSWGEMPIVWQWESFCAPDTKGLSMCSSRSGSSRNSKSTSSRGSAPTRETPKGCQWSPVNGGNDNHEWGMALLVSPRFGSLVLTNFFSEK